MNLKQNIGKRITETRKKLGISIKELANRTGELSAARISNWEQGTRSPGPMEAKLLARELDVAASYLLCLSDDTRGDLHLRSDSQESAVPLIKEKSILQSAKQLKQFLETNKKEQVHSEKVSVVNILGQKLSKYSFAFEVNDKSMLPDFNLNDLVIIDPEVKVQPGQYLLVYLSKQDELVIRKYREIDATEKHIAAFQLVPLNSDWAVINVHDKKSVQIIGPIVQHRRNLALSNAI